jgi:hypothetical protein
MRELIFFLAFFLSCDVAKAFSSESFDHKFQLGFNSSTLKVDTKSSSSTTSASTSFNTIDLAPTFIYFLNSQSSATISYLKSISGKYLVSGVIGSYRYYLNQGTKTTIKSDQKKIVVMPTWSPYLSFGYQLLTISDDNGSIDFDGFEFEAGVDYHINESFYTNLKFSSSQLTSGSTRTASPKVIGIAFGKIF